jgi:hypothetical protein
MGSQSKLKAPFLFGLGLFLGLTPSGRLLGELVLLTLYSIVFDGNSES